MNGLRRRVEVGLSGRAYDIHIGPGLLADVGGLLQPLLRRRRISVVTDETVASLHLPALRAAMEGSGIEVQALVLPPGEGTKSWSELARTVEWLLAAKVERGDIVLAFGGGVIGDLVGFAAAILRRGVRYVQVPTTLLAQVDSSVGGKTGINTALGKNLAGAFHQPSMVIADTALLHTLPERDFLAGYGEVVKYGLLGDARFFDWLEASATALKAREQSAVVHAVTRSCEMKAAIVVRDETEQGERALLNLGHTFCHALEAATGYSDRLLHGEGVAIGCVLAFDLSARLGLCPREDPVRIKAHLAAMGMKRSLRDIAGKLPDAKGILALMEQDKKVVDGQLRFVLAHRIGATFVSGDVAVSNVEALLSDALADRE